jgi:TPR repeat protein
VRQDLERAVHSYQLAAAGAVVAKVDIGAAYYYGMGVRKNASTARALFEEAVEKGIGRAAPCLGDMEMTEAKAPEDKARAQHWYEAGARLKDPIAAYDLAYMLGQTSQGTRDVRRMAELLRMSASIGFVEAKYGLGLTLVEHPEFARGNKEARTVLEEASSAGSWKASMVLAIEAWNSRPSVVYFYFYLSTLQGVRLQRSLRIRISMCSQAG